MFNRRKPLDWKQKIKGWFWPQLGWHRYGQYMVAKLSRLGGTPRSIAAGVACGVAISFTPFVGFHFVLAAVTAWIVRGNILASALGTAAGNPWTFPFIWFATLYTGRWLLGEHAAGKVEFVRVFEKAMHALMTFDFSAFASDVWPIIFPMMIGCIPFYILAWVATYYVFRKALEGLSRVKRNRKNVNRV